MSLNLSLSLYFLSLPFSCLVNLWPPHHQSVLSSGRKQIGAVIGVIGHYRRLSLVLFWTLNFKLAAHYAKYHVYTTPIITVLVLLVITTGIEYSPVLNLLHQAKYADTTVHHVSHAHNTYILHYCITTTGYICDTCGLWLSMDSHLTMTIWHPHLKITTLETMSLCC